MARTIVVINQFALPREESGGTRHVDLYGCLEGWDAIFIAGDINHSSSIRFKADDRRFRLVRIPRYAGNGLARVGGWFWYAIRAMGIAVTQRADVYLGSSPHPLAPAAALLAARVRRKPFVLEIRDLWPESIVAAGIASETNLAIRILRAYERFLYKSADAIIGVTPGWRSYFAELGVDEGNLSIVMNGTSESAFPAAIAVEERNRRRKDAGIASPAVIFAGSHGPKDGIGLILDAAEKRPEVNFYLYGGGSDKQNRLEEARGRGLSNVEFREGVAKQELPELLQLFDIGLHVVAPLPVFDRGMSPNKLFDYLAAGLPVVSNARTPLSQVITDGQVGAVTEPEGLAEGIAYVLESSWQDRVRWAAEANRLSSEIYSREAQRTEVRRLLDQVTARRH